MIDDSQSNCLHFRCAYCGGAIMAAARAPFRHLERVVPACPFCASPWKPYLLTSSAGVRRMYDRARGWGEASMKEQYVPQQRWRRRTLVAQPSEYHQSNIVLPLIALIVSLFVLAMVLR